MRNILWIGITAGLLHAATGAALAQTAASPGNPQAGLGIAPIPAQASGCAKDNEQLAQWARANGYQYSDTSSCGATAAPPLVNSASNSGARNAASEMIRLGKLTEWQLVTVHSDSSGFENTWVRKGETSMAWSEMVTLNMIRRPAPTLPEQWLQNMLTRLRAKCGNFEILTQQAGPQTDAAQAAVGLPATYQTAAALVHCTDPAPSNDPRMTLKKHEAIWIKTVRGFQYGYIVTREWHGDELSPDSVLVSAKTRQDWQAWMDAIAVGSGAVRPRPAASIPAAPIALAATRDSGNALNSPPTSADKDEAQQVNLALMASPALARQVRETEISQRLPQIKIQYVHAGNVALGRFGARAEDATIYLSDAFLAEQANNHLYDVVTPGEIYPNSLVFVLGHLVHHIAQPPPQPSAYAPSNKPVSGDLTNVARAYIQARLSDEAQSYIQGWNDMMEAATRENGRPLSAQQISQIIMNFRYRAPFIKAMNQLGDKKLRLQNSGTLEVGDQNTQAIVEALRTTAIPDFD